MSHNHILDRLMKETDAYKHAWRAKDAFDRWLLDKTFTEDLCETLLTETSPELDFEKFRPGMSRSELPQYFVDAMQKSGFPEYLHPYTVNELSSFQLYKVNGLDAGFAIKPDGDIVLVHNNSGTRGIAEKLLKKAVEAGGTHLDHFDGKLSGVYAKQFPRVAKTEPWDDTYAPEAWKYRPLDISQTYFGGEHRHRETPVSPEEMEQVKTNYAAGKPHVIYRTKAPAKFEAPRRPEAQVEESARRVTIGILP